MFISNHTLKTSEPKENAPSSEAGGETNAPQATPPETPGSDPLALFPTGQLHTVRLLECLSAASLEALCSVEGRAFLFGRGRLAREALPPLQQRILTLSPDDTLFVDFAGVRATSDFLEVLLQNLFYAEVAGGRLTRGKQVVLTDVDEGAMIALHRGLAAERESCLALPNPEARPWQVVLLGHVEPHILTLLETIRRQPNASSTTTELAALFNKTLLKKPLGALTSRVKELFDAGLLRRKETTFASGQKGYVYRYYHPQQHLDPQFVPPPLATYQGPRLPRSHAKIRTMEDLTLPEEPEPRFQTVRRSPTLRGGIPLVGRQPQVQALGALLRPPVLTPVLATIVGPGGMGKTRLAQEVATVLTPAYAERVWFVSLAQVRAPYLLAALLATVAPDASQATPLPTLCERLASAPALLVLDNAEHLVETLADLLPRLFADVPALACLVTSTRRVGLPQERLHPLEALTLPPPACTPEQLLASESGQFFWERLRAARPQSPLTPFQARLVGDICTQLQGSPLALLLAATQAHRLPLEELLTRLQDPLQWLVAPHAADKDAAHSSMARVIGWSYDLLPDADHKRFFCGLGVFHGGWSVAAAQAVCEEGAASAYLAELQARSLVAPTERPGEQGEQREEGPDAAPPDAGFAFLELIRAFAWEQVWPQERHALQQRHFAFYLEVAQAAKGSMEGAEAASTLRRLEADHANLRAALDWGLDHAPTDTLRFASALWRFWQLRGYLAEGRHYLEQGLRRVGEAAPREDRAEGIRRIAQLAFAQSAYTEARELALQSVALYREVEAPTPPTQSAIAGVLNELGNAYVHQGRYAEAEAYYGESATLWEALQDARGMAIARNNRGHLLTCLGRSEEARPLLEESLRQYTRLQNARGLANTLVKLANVMVDLGDYAIARALYKEDAALKESLGARQAGELEASLGYVASRQGDATQDGVFYQQAQTLIEQSMRLSPTTLNSWQAVSRADVLGRVLVARGQETRAATLLGFAHALRETMEMGMTVRETQLHAAAVQQLQQHFSPAQLRRYWTAGRELTIKQMMAYVLEAPEGGQAQT